ncbi:hypothetical protein SAMN02910265_02561 [Ruminococcus flavefaciens]|uniref:Dockerin domain-containing protein n=1 Tax=Ruminococcus flavefaciens TaxID=1265 RepID=A0A1H6KM52_RUMFL|nr:dockerin type I domain-containing protein [Ruminococcus flavefaciens]SEH76466.1 hypothetical protein SAMN02910265_02561 [Ruminococcus flavefaciens]
MKKTIRTVLTAAAFAAAGVSAMTAVAEGREPVRMEFNNETERDVFKEFYGAYGPPPTSIPMWDETTTTEALETLTSTTTTLTTTMPRTVYGPTSTSTVTTSEQEDIVELTTTMLPQPAYGPAPTIKGDVNGDYTVDIFDSIAMRKAILFDEYADTVNLHFSDLNKDGKISVGDLVILNKYLLGKIKDLDNYPAKKVDDEIVVTTTYDPRTDIVAPVYGPAPVYEIRSYATTAEEQSASDGNINTTNEEK